MNNIQLNNLVKELAEGQPLVHSFTTDSPYENWNTNEVEYGSVSFCIKSKQMRERTSQFTALMYYGDRLLEDKSNRDAVQSDAVSVLTNIINGFDNIEGVDVVAPADIQLFEQEFADYLAGGYVTVNLVVESDADCDIVETRKEYATKEYVDARDQILSDRIDNIKECDCFPYTSLEKQGDYFYKIGYGPMDYEYAKNYFKGLNVDAPAGACLSFKDGNKYYRNFDWYYSNRVTFLVDTQHVHGVAGMDSLTKAIVESDPKSDLFKILPFYLVDGVNDRGVYANINVVNVDETYGPTTTIEGDGDEICVLEIVRYVLDHFDNAPAAIAYLRDHAKIYNLQALIERGLECHFMIGDANNCYVVEFINNEVTYSSKHILSNFYMRGFTPNEDGTAYGPIDVPDHTPSVENGLRPMSAGVERYNKVALGLDDPDIEDKASLLADCYYTKAYTTEEGDEFWYSEFVGGDLNIDSEADDFHERIAEAKEAFRERTRESGKTWETRHSCVYDLDNLTLSIVIEEDESFEYQFKSEAATQGYVDSAISALNISVISRINSEISDVKTWADGKFISAVDIENKADISYVDDAISNVQGQIDENVSAISALSLVVDGKQDVLTAGENISIVNNVISAIVEEVPVKDVQIQTPDGYETIVDENGDAKIPMATKGGSVGVVTVNSAYGLTMFDSDPGILRIARASDADIDAGTTVYKPIVPSNFSYALQHALGGYQFAFLTQSEYDALVTKDAHTIYFIVG